MLLRLLRRAPEGESLRGALFSDGGQCCPVLERTSCAVPAGWYRLEVTFSPRFRRRLPLLRFVPGREGIRIHRGTRPEHSSGCILVSADDEKRLTAALLAAQSDGEENYIDIRDHDPYPLYDIPCPPEECMP